MCAMHETTTTQQRQLRKGMTRLNLLRAELSLRSLVLVVSCCCVHSATSCANKRFSTCFLLCLAAAFAVASLFLALSFYLYLAHKFSPKSRAVDCASPKISNSKNTTLAVLCRPRRRDPKNETKIKNIIKIFLLLDYSLDSELNIQTSTWYILVVANHSITQNDRNNSSKIWDWTA